MKEQVLGIPKLPCLKLTEGQENRDFLRGASLCRCITFPDNLPHLEVRWNGSRWSQNQQLKLNIYEQEEYDYITSQR